ncbi:radical SAM protein [Streptomyces sp. NPDC048644]|uniref:radical SAM protein n=1 Tax=Streptomyces sp. NPDC048644 TaxID=3365582 RepID=UPI003712B188
MTAIIEEPTTQRTTDFLWLDLTRKCQLACVHCYNGSGPDGSHGAMSRADWVRVLDEAADLGVRHVQLIGGEPTLHPDGLTLADHALSLGLAIEVYSNLVHVTDAWWQLLQRDGASLATSYYSDRADEHAAVTGRPRSHARTLANIKKALQLGIPLRAGLVGITDTQRVEAARQELEALGVQRINVDHARPFGRAAQDQAPSASGLCGQCGTGRASIGPDGTVSPCIMSAALMGVGNVRTTALGDILGGPALIAANTEIRLAKKKSDDGPCDPACDPNAECSPGFPSSECDPRR